MKTILRRRIAGVASLALIGAARRSYVRTEIKVVTSGAFTTAYLELVPEYERATHNKLATEFDPDGDDA
jgi:ABC-type molybdate transport system substrate-binding protein